MGCLPYVCVAVSGLCAGLQYGAYAGLAVGFALAAVVSAVGWGAFLVCDECGDEFRGGAGLEPRRAGRPAGDPGYDELPADEQRYLRRFFK